MKIETKSNLIFIPTLARKSKLPLFFSRSEIRKSEIKITDYDREKFKILHTFSVQLVQVPLEA